MGTLLAVGTAVLIATVHDDHQVPGNVVGHAFLNTVNRQPTPVYLVELYESFSNYLAETGLYITVVVVHPENLAAR